jgi:tripartite ATP-independent transporter DctM subunit
MSPEVVGAAGFAILLALIALRAPIALALILVGGGGLAALHGVDTLLYVAGEAPVTALSNYTLTALPLFLFMGALTVRIGMADALFSAAHAMVGHRRGGLAMASILSCGGFGAVCGSSVATVTTMARIAVPPMLRLNYDPRLAGGSVAAGATLGILIPPSLPLIIYAVLTETSVGRLFAAGLVPGLIAILFYSGAVVVVTQFNPAAGPVRAKARRAERLASLRRIWTVGVLFLIVMGGIFAGFFTPTEGAAMGAAGTILIGLITGKLSRGSFAAAVQETVETTAMILAIIIGISFFEYFLQASRIPDAVSSWIGSMDLGPTGLVVMLILLFAALGCVLDSIAILFIFTPIVFPLVLDAGLDPVWFGIIMVMVVEFGLLTPPFGMNVFLLSKVSPQIGLGQAFAGVMPFVIADVGRIALLVALPGLTLFLPRMLFG